MSQWIIIMLIVIAVLAVFFLTVMVIDGNRFHVVNYEIVSPKIKNEHSFVVLSDLHNKEYGKNNEKLLKKINKEVLNCEKAVNLIIKSNVAIESDCDIMVEEMIRIIHKLDNYLLYFSEFEFFDIIKKIYLLYQVVILKKRLICVNNE